MTVLTLGVSPGSYCALLPCVDANLEALLRHARVADVLTVLGGPCGMVAQPPDELRLQPVDRDEWIARTGLELVRVNGLDGAGLLDHVRSLVERRTPALVYADAFTVPWNPYRGQEHHEHAFVVDGTRDDGPGRLHIVDAYSNVTRYGTADPCELWLDASDLVASLAPDGERFTVAHLTGAAHGTVAGPKELQDLVTLNVAAAERSLRRGVDASALAEYLPDDPVSEQIGWLALATWLATRSRRLHALWWTETEGLAALAPPAPVVELGSEEVVPAWQEAQTGAYLAWRRVEAGRACPPSLRASLVRAAAADRAWFDAMQRWLDDAGIR